jgi:hypothetical protein
MEQRHQRFDPHCWRRWQIALAMATKSACMGRRKRWPCTCRNLHNTSLGVFIREQFMAMQS